MDFMMNDVYSLEHKFKFDETIMSRHGFIVADRKVFKTLRDACIYAIQNDLNDIRVIVQDKNKVAEIAKYNAVVLSDLCKDIIDAIDIQSEISHKLWAEYEESKTTRDLLRELKYKNAIEQTGIVHGMYKVLGMVAKCKEISNDNIAIDHVSMV